MTVRPLRFVQASDWRLERPPRGLAEVPDQLRELLLDAPFRAATRVFDAVLHDAADFLLLAGDILQPALAGPRSVLYLTEQFERLAAKNIAAYWAYGPAELADDWLSHVVWPANVHVFSTGHVEQIEFARDGRPLARILGCGYDSHGQLHASDFHPESSPLPTIAVLHAAALHALPGDYAPQPHDDSEQHHGNFRHQLSATVGLPNSAETRIHTLADKPTVAPDQAHFGPYDRDTPAAALSNQLSLQPHVNYWAIGGLPRHEQPLAKPKSPAVAIAQSAIATHGFYQSTGTHQGRAFDESGPHGSFLITRDDPGRWRTQFQAADVIRWHELQRSLPSGAKPDAIEQLLAERTRVLRDEAPGMAHLVRWQVIGDTAALEAVRRAGHSPRVLDHLQREFGRATPPVWTVAIDLGTSGPSPAALKQDSLLGDFLRMVTRHQQGAETPLGLERFLPPQNAAEHPPGANGHTSHGMPGHEMLTTAQLASLQFEFDAWRPDRRVLDEAAALGAELLGGHGVGEETGI